MGLIKLIQSAFSFIINAILSILVISSVCLNISNLDGMPVLKTIREVLFWLVPAVSLNYIWVPAEERTLKND